MKYINIRKIGTLAAGTLMLGAALAGPVSAAMDSTGLTKGFFYDANMNPLVQIVVGENPKASPLDAVAAGNIAATVGNLAYLTQDVTVGTEGEVEGEVVISTDSTESVGDYIQDTNVDIALACAGAAGVEILPDFWEDGDRLWFDGDETYEPGDFTIYNVACGRQTEREANILKEGEYKNIFCLFCETLCKEGLEFDISHDMEESIFVDSTGISYFEDGIGDYDSESLKMEIEKDSIRYRVKTGFIPLQTLTDVGTGDEVDFEYRGKILLFGEEYYVTDVKSPASATNTEIHLAKGKVLEDVSNEGYTAEYNGYKFKIDHLIYSAEYVVAGILLNVQKPDGTVVQVQVSKMANGEVDDLEIAGITAEESAAVATGSLLVYDMSTEVVLEDNDDLVLDGEEKKYWEVSFQKGTCNNLGCGTDISEYDDTGTGVVLEWIDITYRHDLDGSEALEVDESLNFPNNFKLTFRGFLDSHYEVSPCSGAGEGNLLVERGSEEYQLEMSFTGEDNNRYDDVRLDEGPFGVNDLFMMDAEVYQFVEAEEENDTAYELTLDPVISGTREKITVNAIEETYGVTADITARFIALVDALDDDDPTDLYKDEEEDFAYEDIYVGDPTRQTIPGGVWVLYDDSSSAILLLDPVLGLADTNVEIDPDVAMSGGTFDRFQVDDNTLDLGLVKEAGTDGSLTYTADVDAAGLANDMNADGDDEDLLVMFTNDDGEDFYLDFSDRNYDEVLNGYYYDNNVWYDCDNSGTVVAGDGDLKIDKDEDTLLVLPAGGDEIEIDWGVDYLIESVEICHPQDKVDASYFIGKEETTSSLEETITKADEGTDVSAGCCTFHVASFDVAGTGGAGTVSTDKVNVLSVADLGKLVVGESAADTDMNLVLVGGPVVNAMAAEVITADDIAAEPDKFLVKKVGTKVVVAGWERGDTVAAGNALIEWLQDNVH